MNWRKQQRPASFRGVPFFVASGERQGGRRTVEHEFPFSEDPSFTEDLGLAGRRFRVDGYVLGSEYTTARDALIEALETPGPGELIHPYYGTRRVTLASPFSVRESAAEGGVAGFSIEFVETSAEPSRPLVVVDAQNALLTAVAAAKAATRALFLANYVKIPAFVGSAVNALKGVSLGIGSLLDVCSVGAQEIASLRRDLADIENNAVALVNTPGALIDGQIALFESLTSALVNGVNAVRPSGALATLYALPFGVRPAATTPSRAIEQKNFDAFVSAIQRVVLVQAATAIITETFDSLDVALIARDEITDLIDAQIDGAGDDAFPAFQALRVALVDAVPGVDRDLPRLQRFTPSVTLPSLVLAHQLYGDVSQELDLVARNRVRNPGFVSGELEVLTRE